MADATQVLNVVELDKFRDWINTNPVYEGNPYVWFKQKVLHSIKSAPITQPKTSAEAQRLRAQGISIEKIAVRFNTNTYQIRKLLKGVIAQ